MLRDIIREYTDVYPEIIERACFVLEKVRRQFLRHRSDRAHYHSDKSDSLDFKDSWDFCWEFRASLPGR